MWNPSNSFVVEEEKAQNLHHPPTKPNYDYYSHYSSSSSSSSSSSIWPTVKPFLNGGLAGVLKVSIGSSCVCGMYYSSCLRAAKHGAAEPSVRIRAELFKTLSKSFPIPLLFEAAYTTARLGSFEILRKKVEAGNDGRPLTLYQDVVCGLTAGAIGASVAFPLYVASQSMLADANRSAMQKMNYVLHAIYRTVADKGLLALWKGGGPYATSVMACNGGMLASYNRSFTYFEESLGLNESRAQLGASTVSGLCASACGLPFWNIAGIMQRARSDAKGKKLFSSTLDCALKVIKVRGPSILCTGSCKYFTGTTGSVMLTWILLEKIRGVEASRGW